jgi:hypothetical protein
MGKWFLFALELGKSNLKILLKGKLNKDAILTQKVGNWSIMAINSKTRFNQWL